MERRIETYGSIKDGIKKISYRDKFMEQWDLWPDCRFRLSVERLYQKRSTKTENGLGENGYYHGIVCSEYALGAYETQQRVISKDTAHQELKANCNFKEHVNEETGQIMRCILSTANLSTVEFEEYMDRCRAFILEWFGRYVPMPNEQSEMDLEL